MATLPKSTQVAKAVAVVTQGSFTSLKDSAFQQAGAHQTLESVARFALTQIKDFPKEVPVEAKDQLYEGYRMKFNALQPAVMYAVINDHYIRATPEHIKADNVEMVEIGIPYAYSFSAQEFGKLANTNPALLALVKEIWE